MKTRPVARALEGLARGSVRRPRTVLAVALLAAAASVAWAVPHLALRTSNLDLVDPGLPPVRHFRDLAREFGTPNVLVVALEGGDETALAAAVDRLEPRLAAVPGVRDVLGRLPLPPGLPALGAGLPAGPPVGLAPYLVSRDRGLYFLFVQPADDESRAETIAPLVAGVRRELEAADLGASGVTAGLTGLPQYAVDDQGAVQHDLGLLSPVSFVLVLALFAGAFSALRRPLAAMAALLAAVAVTLGLAAVWPGHLTLLSAFFGSILFGLGVDFGIHLVDRIEEARAGGGDEAAAVTAAVRGLAPALATGALTTSTAFFTLTLSGFRGFAELGWIAGVGVLVSLLATVTVLPALLVLFPGPPPPAGRRRNRIGAALVRLQSPRLALALALAAILAPLALRPRFDSDYLDLQPRGSEAVRWEREMVQRSAYSPQAAVFVADSHGAAAELVRRLREDPTVGEVQWAGDLPLDGAFPGAGPALTERFVSRAGRYAVYAHPRGDVWDPAVRDAFLDRMQALDPEVTGMPILGRFMIDRSRRALERGAALAALAVFLWVLIDLRDLRLTLLALLPTALGMAGLSASMGLFGVAFNPLSVLALPVVIGIAVDDGVHLTHRFRAEGGDVARALRGTGRGVVLTSATSLAAFGSLAAASHRGLASFALVLSFGVASALAASVLVLPPALARWGRAGVRWPVAVGVSPPASEGKEPPPDARARAEPGGVTSAELLLRDPRPRPARATVSASPDPRFDDRAAAGLWLLLGVYAVTLVVGAIVAPPIYWWIHGWAAGGGSDLAAYLARKEFPRYFDRIRWLMVLAALPWLCRAAGFTTARSLGLRGGPEGRRRLAVWLGVGFSMVAAMAGGQLASGVALVRPGLGVGGVVQTVAIALAAAALVGLLEEVVFRGVVFQLARRSLPAWGAVPVAAAIFALLHFQRVPGDAWPAGTPVTWASGFRVSWESLASIPRTLDPATGVALFLAGSILCLLFLRHESLLPPIGLHAGWVLAARLHDRLLRVPDGVDTRFWGGRHLIDGALPLALLFLLMVGMILALRYSAASLSRRSA